MVITKKILSCMLVFLLLFSALFSALPTFVSAASASSITLSETDYTFADAVAGYGSQSARTVTITNTSTVATGALAVALTGDNPSAFTLSKTSVASISAGRTGTFTVVPKPGLAMGPYSATVTVSNANTDAVDFTVSFEVVPAVYSISLSETGTYSFSNTTVGYGSQSARTVTIANVGNVATGALTVSLSSTNLFTLSKTSITSIAVGKTGTFTVVPKTGLPLGTHTATVTVYNANTPPESFDVSFTVDKVNIALSGSGVFAPAVAGYGAQTAKTVTITNASKTATGALAVALTGGDTSAFKLSKTSVTSVSGGGTGTFTVVPNPGLAMGSYSATLTVSNANTEAATFDVSFDVTPAEFSVSLSETGMYVFPGSTAGYGSQSARTVTIANTGNVATGALTVSISGTNLFTLSKTSIASIAVGKTGTFTVVPKTGLPLGTHTATVTVYNANTPPESFDVSFTVDKVNIALSGSGVFSPAVAGYGAQTAKTVTIANSSKTATGALAVALTGGDTSAFTLSKTSVASISAGRTGTFTVVPKPGLAMGSYSATVTVSNANTEAATFDVSFDVTPAEFTVSLSETGIFAFQNAKEGYGSQSARTVTITNTGNVATGALTISLSNAASFTLSKTAITSTAIGKTNTFTVVPKTGLRRGEHSSIVTVSNANISTSFEVSFTVEKVTKIVCIGDSITSGYGLPSADSYPSQLQKKLGNNYSVLNYGVVSATASSKGNIPYIKSSAYKKVLTSNPDVVIVLLGTNDAKSFNWTPALQSIFKSEYTNLIQSFVNLPTEPVVYVVTPIGAISTGSNAIREPNMASQIRPYIREVASELDLPLIEFESILEGVKSRYQSDGYHPSKSGNDIISNVFYDYITGLE